MVGVILAGILWGRVAMVAGSCLKWLLVMSSLVHTRWLTAVLMGVQGALLFYFVVYGVLLGTILAIRVRREASGVSWGLVSMRRLPPLLGFVMKFYRLGIVAGRVVVVVAWGVFWAVCAVIGYLSNVLRMRVASLEGLREEGARVASGVGGVVLAVLFGGAVLF